MVAAPLLPVTLSDVVVRRRGKRMIGPIALELAAEGVTMVVGPNGSGKTTLLRTIHGLVRPSRGEVVWGVPWDEARLRQAFVFQSPVMLRRTVIQNIAFPLRLSGVRKHSAHDKAAGWAERVGLHDRLDQPAEQLSGGERQKLALARALVRDPDLLILDEPTSNLDGRSTREIELILNDARGSGTRIIMATHDMGQVRRLADHMVFLVHGDVKAHQNVAEFFDRPTVPEAGAFVRGDIVE